MISPDDVVVLRDCDNTMLDNDLTENDLRDHLTSRSPLNSPTATAMLVSSTAQAIPTIGTALKRDCHSDTGWAHIKENETALREGHPRHACGRSAQVAHDGLAAAPPRSAP